MTPNLVENSSSRQAAKKIANICPDARFCGFNLQQKKNGDMAKVPIRRNGVGVGLDTPASQLLSGKDILTEQLGDYIGIVMQSQTFCSFKDKVLHCLDIDTKRSQAPRHISMTRLLEKARSLGLMTEISHSKRGAHIFFLADSDPTLPKKILVAEGQEIEIFGHETGAGKSVMLTGDRLAGEVLELRCSVREFLADCGIEAPTPTPAPAPAPAKTPSQLPSRNINTTDMDKVADALRFVNSDGYDSWIAVGQALQSEFNEGGLHLWIQWSATQPNWESEEDCLNHWKSFKPNKGISIGTLFHMAKENGYKTATKKDEMRSAVEDFQIKHSIPTAPATIITTLTPPTEKVVKVWGEVPLDLSTLEPIDYLIDGFIAHSFSVVAGQPGVGKTTAMMALALLAAGFRITKSPLKTECRRKVIYVSEDTAQVRRSLYAYVKHLGLDPVEVSKWFILIEAQRSKLPDVLQLAENVKAHTVNKERPWLIIDTANATLDIDNENDNSEVGAFVAGLKQTIFVTLKTSITIITHTNKLIGKDDDAAMARGASAWTGDATLTAVLFMDDQKNRYMRLIKTRYEPIVREIRFDSQVFVEVVVSRHGNMQDITCVVAIPQESSEEKRLQEKSERSEEGKEQKIRDKCDSVCLAITNTINQHPEGIVWKVGTGGSNNKPDQYANYHAFKLQDVIESIKGADQSDIKPRIRARVHTEFVPEGMTSGWFVLSKPASER